LIRRQGPSLERCNQEGDGSSCYKAFEIQDDGPPMIQSDTSRLLCTWYLASNQTLPGRKAILVAGGHLTDPPASITFASVVNRESVRIAFLLAALVFNIKPDFTWKKGRLVAGGHLTDPLALITYASVVSRE
jgi:hypothetical protein